MVEMDRVMGQWPDFFGKAFQDLYGDVLFGKSTWSVGERHLLAVFVSQQTRCRW
jgi:alkylhydroperoxidase/carboxymuconolactone decarboxylase family protein YurZ